MILSYLFRLVLLCAATFFMVNAAVSLVVLMVSPYIVRACRKIQAKKSARLLFGLRLLPPGSALFIVLGLCVPSYLWLEPGRVRESIGRPLVLLAALGASLLALSALRGITALNRTQRYLDQCRRVGRQSGVAADPAPIVVVENEGPMLAIAGIFRPQLVASSCVLRELTSEQVEAALGHEQAHCLSHDNLKRLLLQLSPDPLPFVRAFSSLERAWARMAEWAADDQVSLGDEKGAVALAGALVAMARMTGRRPLSMPPLVSNLTADEKELTQRIERLLRRDVRHSGSPRPARIFRAELVVAVMFSTSLVLLSPRALGFAHQVFERLVS